jgi:hypothetical protein
VDVKKGENTGRGDMSDSSIAELDLPTRTKVNQLGSELAGCCFVDDDQQRARCKDILEEIKGESEAVVTGVLSWSENGWTAAHRTCASGSLGCLRALVDLQPAVLRAQSTVGGPSGGKTPAHSAVINNLVEVFRVCVACEAPEARDAMMLTDHRGRTLAHEIYDCDDQVQRALLTVLFDELPGDLVREMMETRNKAYDKGEEDDDPTKGAVTPRELFQAGPNAEFFDEMMSRLRIVKSALKR